MILSYSYIDKLYLRRLTRYRDLIYLGCWQNFNTLNSKVKDGLKMAKFLDENGLDKVFSIIKTNILAKITEVQSVETLPENPDPNVLYLIREDV